VTPSIQTWTKDDIPALCSLGALVESKIAHEINLTGYRMTWMVVSESFLFSAFAVILGIAPSTMPTTARWLAVCLPFLGILLAFAVWPSLFAAGRVEHALLELRGSIDEELKRLAFGNWVNLGLASREPTLRYTISWGEIPRRYVPGLLILGWVVALVARLEIGKL